MDRQPSHLVAWKRCLPVATNNSDEILITRFGDNVLKDHVMNLTALHLPIAAVVDRPNQVPANEFIEVVFCNFLCRLPMFLSNEPFSNPSSYQTFPANIAALRKCTQVEQTCLKIRWQIFVAVVNYLHYFCGHEPSLKVVHGVLHAYRFDGANQPGERSWMVSGSAGVVVAATICVCWEVLHPVPCAPLADMLRPDLEVADVDGDAAALVQRGEQVPRPPERDEPAGPAGLAAEAVADVVDAVLDVVGDLPHLLHPVLPLLVVVDVPLELAEEGLHAGELVVDVLDVVADAGDQGVLLREEAAELVDEGLHGAARGADDQIHNQLPFQ
uniref:Uncharacterized protein n=1 Tax=Oryza punctata TaxID=4537 RepID=A0A0E0MH28_ORYPU